MRFRLIVFDWDGTLMNSVEAIVACTRETLGELRLELPSDQAIRDTIGLGMRETVESYLPGIDPATYDRVLEVYRRHWIETFHAHGFLFEGAREVLDELRGRGHLLAVATGKSRVGLARDFARTGVEPLFHGTRTVSEAPGKPHPGMLLDLLAELAAEPQDALMVGDTVHDLGMARNAAVAAVGVTSGSQSRDVLAELSPLVCLNGVRDLPAWLG